MEGEVPPGRPGSEETPHAEVTPSQEIKAEPRPDLVAEYRHLMKKYTHPKESFIILVVLMM